MSYSHTEKKLIFSMFRFKAGVSFGLCHVTLMVSLLVMGSAVSGTDGQAPDLPEATGLFLEDSCGTGNALEGCYRNSTFTSWNGTDVSSAINNVTSLSLDNLSSMSESGSSGPALISSFQEAECPAEIYSCDGRCGEQPRTACSCHSSCEVYGNCCEDYLEVCQGLAMENMDNSSSDSLLLGLIGSSSVECVGGSLMITSCPDNLDPIGLAQMFESWHNRSEGSSTALLTQHLAAMSPEDLVSKCLNPEVVGTDYLGDVPVTLTGTALHFRNVYCAACNFLPGTHIEFWLGFSVCSPLNALDTAEGDLDPCSRPMTYLPESARPNSCFPNSQLIRTSDQRETVDDNRGTDRDDQYATDNDKTGATQRTSNSPLINAIARSPDNTSSQTELCAQFLSYMSVSPNQAGDIYRNVHCYRLNNNGRDPPMVCEPPVRRVPLSLQAEYWTFKPKITVIGADGSSSEDLSGVDGGTEQVLGSSVELHLEAEAFIDSSYTFKLLGQQARPVCDTGNFVIVNGQCLKIAFFLHMFVSYSFERSSLIKGNYRQSAESYTRFISDTMSSPLSPGFFCESLYVKSNQVSSRQHEGEIQLRCVEIPQSDPDSNATDRANLTEAQNSEKPAQTVNGEPVGDGRVRRYLDFATHGFQTIHAGEGIMKLPGTVEIRLCLTDMLRSETVVTGPQFHDYCASYKLRWHAQANIDGIVGEISLEGIITIICCILSDIGLLVRLALQQVVPFYKSYPAKVQFSLCLTLLLAYTLFLVGGMVDEGSRACQIISTMTHLAFLSALFWMNVTAFEIWRTFRHWRNQVVSRGRASLVLSALYAVGIPLAIVITALVIEELYPWSEFSPNYGEYFCWLNGSMAVAIFFVTPCSAICGMNAIFVGLTLRGLRRQRTSISEFKKSNTVTAITDTTIVVKIILLVGITWLLGLLAAMVNHQVLWIIFTIINASLGFLISAVLVLNKRVFYAVQKKCLCYSTDSIAVVSTQERTSASAVHSRSRKGNNKVVFRAAPPREGKNQGNRKVVFKAIPLASNVPVSLSRHDRI